MRGPGSLLATVLLIAVSLAGCTGSDSDGPGPTRTPTATTSAGLTAEVPQSDGPAKIDITGAHGSPISWRVPAGTTDTSPVGVTQRFLALYGQAGTPGTDPDFTWSAASPPTPSTA